MSDLLTAIFEALSAVLEKVGIVGRARRRINIRADLELLRDLSSFEALKEGSVAHTLLTNHVIYEIAVLSGVDMRVSKRNISWGAVVVASLLSMAFGYWTYVLNESGFRWYSIFPGIFAALMFISVLGLLGQKVETPPADAGEPPIGQSTEPATP